MKRLGLALIPLLFLSFQTVFAESDNYTIEDFILQNKDGTAVHGYKGTVHVSITTVSWEGEMRNKIIATGYGWSSNAEVQKECFKNGVPQIHRDDMTLYVKFGNGSGTTFWHSYKVFAAGCSGISVLMSGYMDLPTNEQTIMDLYWPPKLPDVSNNHNCPYDMDANAKQVSKAVWNAWNVATD